MEVVHSYIATSVAFSTFQIDFDMLQQLTFDVLMVDRWFFMFPLLVLLW